MKKRVFFVVLVLLCVGLFVTSCDDGLESETNVEQSGNDDAGSGNEENAGGEEGGGETDDGDDDGKTEEETSNNGVGVTNDPIVNSSAGVSLTVKLRDLTETSVTFYGDVELADNSTAASFGVLYSEKETFTAATAQNLPIENISGTNYSVATSSLKPATTYYYTSYIKQGGLYKYAEIRSFTTASLVAPKLNVRDVTEVSAIFYGTVRKPSGSASDLEYGVEYSAYSDFSSVVTAAEVGINSNNEFSLLVSSFSPASKYYYRSYVRMNGVYDYGEIKFFTTASLVAPTLYDAVYITEESASISGTVSLSMGVSSDLEYGFQYSTYSDFSSCVTNKKVTDIDSKNYFLCQISSLEGKTVYYYRSYIRMNNVYVYGEPRSFKTKGIDPKIPSGYTNLSASGTANCYIVSQKSSYCFLVAKGNQDSNLLHKTKSAIVLWESLGTASTPLEGDLVRNVSYKDGYITFQTADTFKEGNAVVAAKDASGNILWSWHIWLTDQPQGQVYYNGAGTMMDRNLGATSATPGDVGALGLLYQWGRKDPFLGSSSISSSTIAKSTISWPSAVSSTSLTGTVSYVTANPMTFVRAIHSTYFDWHFSSRDNTLWTTSDKEKSIYDPCPAGWRVPDGGSSGVWSKALGSSSSFTQSSLYNSSNEGMNFSGKFGSTSTIWYPASGCSYSGDLSSVGEYGHYWSASPSSDGAYYLYFSYDGGVRPSRNYERENGRSVRCIQE